MLPVGIILPTCTFSNALQGFTKILIFSKIDQEVPKQHLLLSTNNNNIIVFLEVRV